jgi:hypothetical protein
MLQGLPLRAGILSVTPQDRAVWGNLYTSLYTPGLGAWENSDL